ncbi:MAG TPA: helix-turn-helix domain-containing protein [Candidatus Thermoplasmatota archaeon]|nr:helix-turn-helix domain-containing protein [Candidatus Thermoplasmatota archaeon]
MMEALEALGLSAYEAKALEHLLRHGDRTGPDLSRESGIPFGRVYDTLHLLAEKGLVTEKGGRPRVFSPVALDAVPPRLLATQKRRIQESERGLEKQAAALEAELKRLHPQSAPGATAYGVRLGEDAARSLLIEATHEARTRVAAYLAFESIRDDDLQLFDAFRDAVVRGVRTRMIIRESDVEYLMGTPYVAQVLDALLPHLGETLQVRLVSSASPPFSVLDGRRVMIGVRNPLDPTHYLAVVHLEDPAFAGELERKFDRMWREAELDRSVLQKVLRKLESEGSSTRTGRFLQSVVRRRAARSVRRRA